MLRATIYSKLSTFIKVYTVSPLLELERNPSVSRILAFDPHFLPQSVVASYLDHSPERKLPELDDHAR